MTYIETRESTWHINWKYEDMMDDIVQYSLGGV